MRRLFLTLLTLLAAPELRAAPAPAITCLSALTDLYERILSDSVDPVGTRALVMGSLSGLAATHPALAVAERDGQLTLSLHGKPAGSWPLPGDGADKAALNRWIEALAAVIEDSLPEIDGDGETWRSTCRRMAQSALSAAHPHNAHVYQQNWSREAKTPPAGTVRDHMRGTVLVVAVGALHRQTGTDVQAAIARGRAAGMTALVLDLRNNPGGLLDQVVAITDQFVESGPLLTARTRRPEDTHHFNARPGALGLPLAVLVDGRSFLGAEAIAATLQERAGAVIIGTATPGRGEIATLLPTPGFLGDYVRLVTASLETPAGLPIGGRGVLPDICTAGGSVRELPKDAMKHWPAARGAAVDALRALCPPEDHGGGEADIDAAIDWLTRAREP